MQEPVPAQMETELNLQCLVLLQNRPNRGENETRDITGKVSLYAVAPGTEVLLPGKPQALQCLSFLTAAH